MTGARPGRWARRQRRVGRDEDLRVAGAGGELGGELQRVAEVAGLGATGIASMRLAHPAEVGRLVHDDARAAIRPR